MTKTIVAGLFLFSPFYYFGLEAIIKSTTNKWYKRRLAKVLAFGGLFYSTIFVFYGLHLLLSGYINNIGTTDESLYVGVKSYHKILFYAITAFISNLPYLIIVYGALGIYLYCGVIENGGRPVDFKYGVDGDEEEEYDDYDDDYYSPFDGNEYEMISEVNMDMVYEEPDSELVEKKLKIKRCWIDKGETNAIIVGNCYLTGEEVMVSSIKIKRCLDLETGNSIKSVVEFLKDKVLET